MLVSIKYCIKHSVQHTHRLNTAWSYSCPLLPPRNEPGTNSLHLSNKFDSDYFK